MNEINMPKVREFVKKLGPEYLRKFEVQWAGGNEERLEQLQEILLEEQEREMEHREYETRTMGEEGIFAFKKIDEEYQGYLSQEKSSESKDK